MALMLKKAVKYGAKMRLALYGPSGSGKTFTALTIAQHMAEKRIAVIDTERGSASKYADIFDFDVIELNSFHPHEYIEAIRMVVQAKEYDVLIIDSATHEWDGTKGALEMAGQNFTNWAKVTPLHNSFVDAMLEADIDLIVTMRAKEEHVMEKVEGKSKPEVRSVGIEPIQRKGIQYEFDVVGSLDLDNTMSIIKTRCSALQGLVFHKAGKSFVDVVKPWLSGIPQLSVRQVYEACISAGVCTNYQSFYAYASVVLNVAVSKDNVMQLSQEQLQQLIDGAKEEIAS